MAILKNLKLENIISQNNLLITIISSWIEKNGS